MFKRIKAAYAAHVKATTDLSASANTLTAATNCQTDAIAQLAVTMQSVHETMTRLEEHSRYLARAEKHRRQQMGIRDAF